MENSVINRFEAFRCELDSKHDLWENIVKKSRDITIHSKRLIFHLHRIKSISSRNKLISEADEKLKAILLKWRGVAELLVNQDTQAFLKAYSSGLQEFIEAVEFLNFFKHEDTLTSSTVHNCILGITHIKQMLCFNFDNKDNESNNSPLTVQISVPISEYLLGIADVSGEAMRMCITASGLASGVGLTNSLDLEFAYKRAFMLSAYINIMHTAFVNFSVGFSENKWCKDKISTMSSSLHKTEDACYSLKLQKQEEMLLSF